MKTLTISLDPEEYEDLIEMARQQRRSPRDQAAHIVAAMAYSHVHGLPDDNDPVPAWGETLTTEPLDISDIADRVAYKLAADLEQRSSGQPLANVFRGYDTGRVSNYPAPTGTPLDLGNSTVEKPISEAAMKVARELDRWSRDDLGVDPSEVVVTLSYGNDMVSREDILRPSKDNK